MYFLVKYWIITYDVQIAKNADNKNTYLKLCRISIKQSVIWKITLERFRNCTYGNRPNYPSPNK